MEIPKKYVLPCKTNGMCSIMAYNEHFNTNYIGYQIYGKRVTTMPNWTGKVLLGVGLIEFEPFGSPGYEEGRVTFKCCIGCGLPWNNDEAIRLNDLIGLELPAVETLRERMANLKRKVNGT